MDPAFRSKRSAAGFCLLIVFFLTLPFIISLIGLPPRVEAYRAIPVRFGVPGREIQAIYNDPKSPDVVFLGSSLVMTAIFPEPLEQALAKHLGRPAHVTVLGMAWQGLDLQYFILRDFLEKHHPGLIVLNEPAPGYETEEPHPEAYRWFRYGEFRNDFDGLSPGFKLLMYGHMVLGAPRELLSKLRPNLMAEDETSRDSYNFYLLNRRESGYLGEPFISEDQPISVEQQARLLPLNSPLISISARRPGPYSTHFFEKIVALAKQHNCKLVFLHIPTDDEYGRTTIPELGWPDFQTPGGLIIGVPASVLYLGMSRERFLHYYGDSHVNKNGSALFTAAVIPALSEAYDQSR